MSRSSGILVIGIGGHAVAVDPATGTEIWRTKLKGTNSVTVWHTGSRVYVGAGGELFALDPATGHILWRNELKRLGLDIITFGATSDPTAITAAESARGADVHGGT